LATDVAAFRAFMETCLGARVTELIQLDNGRTAGCWFMVSNKTYDLACTEDHSGGLARLRHVTYATDTGEDILRAADMVLENGVHIETGPHEHALQGTFFLYVWEPAGNRDHLRAACLLAMRCWCGSWPVRILGRLTGLAGLIPWPPQPGGCRSR
jgi:catechol 2,3-dioxygenase